jgi:ABC-type bacteriocin/lantibiotic exporter with double-glycine peptidase domain
MSAIDVGLEKNILKNFKCKFFKEKSMIFISNRKDIIGFCNKIIIFNDGKV